jgi:hypothetical protein
MLLPIGRLLQLFTVMLVCMLSLLPRANAQTPTIAEFTEGMTEKSGLIPLYYNSNEDKIYLAVSNNKAQFFF